MGGSCMLEPVIILAGRILFGLFRAYFLIIENVVKFLFPSYRRHRLLDKIVSGEFELERVGIDDRIRKIDLARENLSDAIRAVDDLRTEADANKKELGEAIARFELLQNQKAELDSQLESLRAIAQVDTNSFRQIVGLPTKTDIWRERLLGFGSGILASIVASVIIIIIQGL